MGSPITLKAEWKPLAGTGETNQYFITWTTDSLVSPEGVENEIRIDYLQSISDIAEPTAPSFLGYHFTGWSNGSMANPDTLMIDRDSVLTASFAKNTYTVEVHSSDQTIGSVNGGGVFEYLDTTVLTATAVAPYHFVRWSDGNTQNPRQFVVTSNAVRTAIFGIDTFCVSLLVDSITHGTCTGFGNYPYASAASVVAVPYSGYQFSHWSDGSTYNPYTFAVINDVQLTAFFYANGTPYQDTLVVHDTIYREVPVHDTIFIHDTIYVTQGIDDTETINAKIYQHNGHVVVEGANGNTVTLYDINGRMLATKQDYDLPLSFAVPATGTYMIKIGEYPARRVVVIR